MRLRVAAGSVLRAKLVRGGLGDLADAFKGVILANDSAPAVGAEFDRAIAGPVTVTAVYCSTPSRIFCDGCVLPSSRLLNKLVPLTKVVRPHAGAFSHGGFGVTAAIDVTSETQAPVPGAIARPVESWADVPPHERLAAKSGVDGHDQGACRSYRDGVLLHVSGVTMVDLRQGRLYWHRGCGCARLRSRA